MKKYMIRYVIETDINKSNRTRTCFIKSNKSKHQAVKEWYKKHIKKYHLEYYSYILSITPIK